MHDFNIPYDRFPVFVRRSKEIFKEYPWLVGKNLLIALLWGLGFFIWAIPEASIFLKWGVSVYFGFQVILYVLDFVITFWDIYYHKALVAFLGAQAKANQKQYLLDTQTRNVKS